MGKSRRSTANARRVDPIAVKVIKAVKPPTDPELAAIRETRILPVINNLRSPDPKVRSTSSSAVSNIVQDEKCRKLLLREQIVPILLTETLTDASLDSRAAGWEILRVLVSEEEPDFCVHLFRLDILTAIEHAAKNVVQALSDSAFTRSPKLQQQVTWNITNVLVFLISAVATARDEMADAVASNPHILPFLCFLVNHSHTPKGIIHVQTLNCLMTLSEDNLKISQSILSDPSNCFRTLMKFREGTEGKTVYSCGLLHNMFSSLEWHDASPGQDGATDAQIIPTLSNLLTRLRQDPKTGQISGVPAELVTLALDILASIATHLQLYITKGNQADEWDGIEDDEAMGNDDVGHGNKESDEGEDDAEDTKDVDMDTDGEKDDMDIPEVMEDMDLITDVDDGAEHDRGVQGVDDLPTLKEFVGKATPQIIRMAKLAPSSDEAVAIQSQALAALNNIAWTISCFDFSEAANAGILKIWTPVANRLWSDIVAPVLATDTADISLASLVTSIAWAVSRSLQGSITLAGDEHRKFMCLYQASKRLQSGGDGQRVQEEEEEEEEGADPFLGLGVKCIGVLGQLAQDSAPISRNRDVGIFLVTILDALPDTPAADAIEALNQLMDMYGDETQEWDRAIFWKDNFLTHLEDILPKAKAMAKTIEKRGGTLELRIRADEAVVNLGRFIQYKKQHPPKS